MNDYAWLRNICDLESSKGLRANPWCVPVDGREISVATAGRLLVAVDGNYAAAPPVGDDGEKIIKQINSVMKKDDDKLLGRVTSADLSAWCGPFEADVEETCECCDGDGQCECCECGEEHDCGQCEGSGKQTKRVVRYGKVGESFVDRNRMAQALDHLSGDVIVSEVPTKLLRFEGPGWTVIAAYLSRGPEGIDDVPALSIEMPATLIAEGV